MSYLRPSAFAMLLWLAGSAAATERPITADGGNGFDSPAVAAFIDSLFPAQLAEHRVPGGVIVIVHADSIALARGYGYADVAQQRPVDPATTLFRVASLAKLFTTVAILQLGEQGRLNLRSDIAPYLGDLQIRRRFDAPVTLAQILTHTSGFENSDIGDAARSADEVIPLADFVANRMTQQTLPPGQFMLYSNHAFTLGGYIIQQISGLPYAEYMQHHVLNPLQMRHSSFVQPLPAVLQPHLATGYAGKDTGFVALPLDFSNVVPADGLLASGLDMAHFMIACLNQGRFDGAQVLSPAMLDTMLQQQFTYHPRLPGRAFGFVEDYIAGDPRLRLLRHTGGQLGFTCELILYPAERLGIFIALNRRLSRVRSAIVGQFARRFYPVVPDTAAPQPPLEFADRASRFTGDYRFIGYVRGTIEKLAQFAGGGIYPVRATQDGTLSLWSDELVEVGPRLFRWRDRGGYIAFGEVADGTISHFFSEGQAFERLHWHQSQRLHQVAFGIMNLLFLSVLAWPVLRRRRPDGAYGGWLRVARPLALLVAVLALALTAGLLIEINRAMAAGGFDYGFGPAMRVLLSLPYLIAALALLLPIFAILAWRRNAWTRAGRIHYSLIALTSLGFGGFMLYWNILQL